MSDRGAMRQIVTTVSEQRGGVDIVVANAGIRALPAICGRRGHIVVVSSVCAFANGVRVARNAVAKAGVEQLARALRVELAPHGVSVSIAYFGFIDTEMVHRTIDGGPVAQKTLESLPKPLQKHL